MPTPLPALSLVTVQAADTTANSWLKAQLGGVKTPGTIPVGGLRGFKRETGWDVKKGKGTKGATLTLKDQPPVEGTVICQLTTAQDFADWDDFVANVLDTDPETQQAEGLSWYYPGHVSISLSVVVIKHYTGIEYQGRGMYHGTFEIIEWGPPPAKSIVQTPAQEKPDANDPDTPPAPEDPRLVALQAQLKAAEAAAAAGGKS